MIKVCDELNCENKAVKTLRTKDLWSIEAQWEQKDYCENHYELANEKWKNIKLNHEQYFE